MTTTRQEEKPFRASCSGRLLLVGFAFVSLSGWLRAWNAIDSRYWLDRAGDPALYLAVSGAVWGIIGLAVLIWLWLGLRWMGLVALIGALLVAFTYWADRLALGKPYGLSENAAFATGFTLLGLALVVYLARPDMDLRKLRSH